jgi:hypothetical protein
MLNHSQTPRKQEKNTPTPKALAPRPALRQALLSGPDPLWLRRIRTAHDLHVMAAGRIL